MEEKFFKDMMKRWGVKPGKGKNKQWEPDQRPTAQPPQPKQPEPEALDEAEPVNEDEAMFFRAMNHMGVKDIEQGKHSGIGHERGMPPTKSATPEEDRLMFVSALNSIDGQPSKDVIPDQETREALRKLKLKKRDQISYGATLDLHGHRTEDALKELASFVAAQFAKGSSSVMVITGKGKHSSGGVGVIKPAVERWILHKGKRFIQSYAEAPKAYGGAGAFLIFLRDK